MTTEAGKRLHNRIFGLSDVMPGGAELDSLIAAIEREATATADAEIERLRSERDAAYCWIVNETRFRPPLPDHACHDCAPDGDPEFTCAYHRARAALAPKEPTR